MKIKLKYEKLGYNLLIGLFLLLALTFLISGICKGELWLIGTAVIVALLSGCMRVGGLMDRNIDKLLK